MGGGGETSRHDPHNFPVKLGQQSDTHDRTVSVHIEKTVCFLDKWAGKRKKGGRDDAYVKSSSRGHSDRYIAKFVTLTDDNKRNARKVK